MRVEEILEEHGLTRATATKYIEAIIRLNQTQTAKEIDVSGHTVNRYKNAFKKMSETERLQIIASLTTDKLLQNSAEQ